MVFSTALASAQRRRADGAAVFSPLLGPSWSRRRDGLTAVPSLGRAWRRPGDGRRRWAVAAPTADRRQTDGKRMAKQPRGLHRHLTRNLRPTGPSNPVQSRSVDGPGTGPSFLMVQRRHSRRPSDGAARARARAHVSRRQTKACINGHRRPTTGPFGETANRRVRCGDGTARAPGVCWERGRNGARTAPEWRRPSGAR